MRPRSHLLLIALALHGQACAEGPADPSASPGWDFGCDDREVDAATLLAQASGFASRHGVATTMAFEGCPEHPFLTCDPIVPLDYAPISIFLDQMDEDLASYPADLFTTIRLDYLVFGRNLARQDADHHPLGGAVVRYGDHRSVMVVNTDALAYCSTFANRRIAHHEIAHAIDFGFAGVTDGTWWTGLNPPGFAYGGVDLDATDLLEFSHPLAGFITPYGRMSVSEDYAEIYAAMWFPEEGDDLAGWLARDAYLRIKTKTVLEALRTRWPAFVESLPNYARVP